MAGDVAAPPWRQRQYKWKETIALRRCPPQVTCSGELWISFDSSDVPPAYTSRMSVSSTNWSTTSSSTKISFFQRNGHITRTHRHPTATSNARFWVWVHLLVNLVAMAFLFTMNLYLPWVLNFNLSQARLLKETACNYVFSVLVHGIPSISAWISIHQNSQKLFCAKTSIGH